MMFSVIMPLYNKAPYVAKAIGSVLAQTISDYEMIIVDDGSKDGSGEIAERMIEGNDHCKLIRQKNAGVSVARNNGVAASRGDYLCFLDADDWWEPTFLEEMKILIEEFPDAGIYGTNYTIIKEIKHKTRIANIGFEDGFERGYINYCRAYADTMYMPLWTGAICIPRDVFIEQGGFPNGIKLGEDFLLWIKIALAHDVVFLNKPLAYYNQDVDVANRGVGHLYLPSQHMLWNLDFLSEEEKDNPDFKRLVDQLRTYELMPYYLSKRYRNEARRELAKVDWEKQPPHVRNLYKMPIFFLLFRACFMKCGSRIKQRFFLS